MVQAVLRDIRQENRRNDIYVDFFCIMLIKMVVKDQEENVRKECRMDKDFRKVRLGPNCRAIYQTL